MTLDLFGTEMHTPKAPARRRKVVSRDEGHQEGGQEGRHEGRKEVTIGLSLGAGVQSTTMLVMALNGDLPRPDVVVFADTQWEPQGVYDHLTKLEARMAAAGYDYRRVTWGNIREYALQGVTGERPDFPGLPFRTPGALMRRQCTRLFKVRPIKRAMKAKMREQGRKRIEQWVGISLDEIERMRDSDVAYIDNRYPLVEARMSRTDCLRYLEAHGEPLPGKSACIGCPFRSNKDWRALTPTEWADAVDFDARIRRIPRFDAPMYLHHALVPLPMADLGGGGANGQLDLFAEECSGHCGV